VSADEPPGRTDRDLTPCYICRDADGVVVGAAVDKAEWAKDTARFVGKWIKHGLTIERVPSAWVREHFGTADRYVGG
jgi:hypothetical protein